MQLSIIIVNYNVRYFLEQCIISVKRALEGIDGEVIVVDNNSSDGSQEMIRSKFGETVIFIENHDNPGFSKANNQGIAIAKGAHILLLNPDTVVEETTFSTCLKFMEANPSAGALGVKMLDGQGVFLPESKRALPTPLVSFYKIFGLAALFPQNKAFGQYHLTYLDKDENHPIEILSGAFMWMRKKVVDKIGGLDETFFMYGEDIDQSYRVIQAGWHNHYLADTRIIHYKGESTKKGSLNYVKVFYQAMIIFAKKHFGGRNQQLFIFFIKLAVYLRAFLAVLRRGVKKLGFPMIEAGLIYAIIQGIKAYWEHYVRYIEGGSYPESFDQVAAPVYTLVFVGLLGLAGGYRRPFRIPPLIMATFWGFVAIATVSYVVPEINFSRAIVGLSSIFTLIMAISTRGLVHLKEKGNFFFTEARHKRVILAGDENGVLRLAKMLRNEVGFSAEIVGVICPKAPGGPDPWLGTLGQSEVVITHYRASEIVFDADSLGNSTIIRTIEELAPTGVEMKIRPPGANFVIGSQEVYAPVHQKRKSYALATFRRRTQKKVFDWISGLGLLLSFPLLFYRYKRPGKAFECMLQALFGQRHLVGYIEANPAGLPPLKPGLLTMRNRLGSDNGQQLNAAPLDEFYAKTYSWELDAEIVFRSWRYIGT
ncbi:MAG: glycosyltransferase [Bacteroidota bacterium]